MEAKHAAVDGDAPSAALAIRPVMPFKRMVASQRCPGARGAAPAPAPAPAGTRVLSPSNSAPSSRTACADGKARTGADAAQREAPDSGPAGGEGCAALAAGGGDASEADVPSEALPAGAPAASEGEAAEAEAEAEDKATEAEAEEAAGKEEEPEVMLRARVDAHDYLGRAQELLKRGDANGVRNNIWRALAAVDRWQEQQLKYGFWGGPY
eukprot:scaffold5.g843.t1